MTGSKTTVKKSFFSVFRRLLSMVLVAVMLGFSNVILEEERSVNDTRVWIEVVEVMDEESDID